MKNQNINVKISQIRKESGEFFSNIYTDEFKNILDVKETKNTIAVLVQDRDVKRGYFATGNLEDLIDNIYKWPESTGIDFLSRKGADAVTTYLNKIGFIKYAVYVKAENNKISETLSKLESDKFQYQNCRSFISDISEEDAEKIHDFLYESFNPLTSHIETTVELCKRILRGDIVIHKENGELTTVLTFDTKLKTLYMEHMLNKGKSEYMHMLYYYILKKEVEKGTVSVSTWIRETNLRAFNFVRRYGLMPSGLKNFVFCKEK